jgi:hypothetical protein
MDGLSLLDPTQARTQLLTEAWGATGAGTWAALRTKAFHYIEYYRRNGVTPREDIGGVVHEYYDLTTDPYELTNLLRDGDPDTPDPAMIADLSTRLRKERLCAGSTCSPGVATETADTKPPKLRVFTPKPDALVNGVAHFSADASDNLGVENIEFYEGSNLLLDDDTPPFEVSWDTSALPTGTYDLRAVAKDEAGNSDTVDFQVRVERFDVQSANSPESGSTPGHIESGDTLTYFFDHVVAPTEIVPGWDGLPRSSIAQIAPDDPFQDYNDTLSIVEAPALGIVNLGRPDYWGWREPIPVEGQHFILMDLAADGRSLTIEFGAGTQTGFPPNGGTMVWTPSPSLCSAAPVCRVTESGPTVDVDF